MDYGTGNDAELMERVRVGFEEKARISSRIENRPKTPRKINKKKRTVSIAKNVIIINEKKELCEKKTTKQKEMKRNSSRVVRSGVYICYICEKTYKTKKGVLRHMIKCGK
tara:strand:- start:250 stop:579 length:330 start_codon:yes stop_codon:yes gene_type:complete